MKRLLIALLLTALVGTAAPAAPRWMSRYILLLQDKPVAEQMSSRKDLHTQAAITAAARIESAQSALKAELAQRNVQVVGSVRTLLNAVFVAVPQEKISALSGLPGVVSVIPARRLKLHMNRALDLVNAPQAWAALGGIGSAGTGVKIAVVDTGIDQNHLAFRNDTTGMQAPAGYPPANASHPNQTAFTNGKVIVARSYVPDVAMGVNQTDPAIDSRPDDLSPRDHVGHGTAVAMIAAGAQHTAPNGAVISGVAPKAYLGSYKVYGSPGVNDFTYDSVVVAALEDAYNDGMDVVVLAQGSLATYAPKDTGTVCNEISGTPCDVRAQAIESAVNTAKGMTIVTSAGNDGDLGLSGHGPTLNTIHTPGTAPSGITVGATTNSHNFYSTVAITGTDAPANLTTINAMLGDGPRPASPLTAPIRDVAAFDTTGLACGAITGNLTGAIALIQRGGQCGFETKALNAQKAGAIGIIFYQTQDRDYVIEPFGQVGVSIPAAMVSYTDGKAIKDFIAANPNRQVTINPALREVTTQADTIAFFSSRGPSIADTSALPEVIKPELVAPGMGIYTATQSYDPNSDLYRANGYTTVQGTSFSAAFVAGAAALVKQRNPAFTPAKVKSAIVNTATGDNVLDAGSPASAVAMGAGKLNVQAAVQTNVTIEPATISFGVLNPYGGLSTLPLPITRSLTITNTGTAAIHLDLAVVARASSDTRAQVSVDTPRLDLAAGASQQIGLRLTGSLPVAGSYEGVVTVVGGAAPLRVPYLYLVGDNSPYNLFPVLGYDYIGLPNQLTPGDLYAFKLLDRFGVPVYGYASMPPVYGGAKPGYEVVFRPTLGGGHMWNVPGDPRVDPATDVYGFAVGWAYLGPSLGEQEFTATVGGLSVPFGGVAINPPAISTGGVVDAASYAVPNGFAPGSYISIFGSNLSSTTRAFNTPYLPPSLAGVSVGFDVTGTNPGWPGHIHVVKSDPDGQINVQIPWELQGKTSAKMKVAIVRNYIDSYTSALYTVPIAPASPGIFEIPDPTGGSVAAALDPSYKIVSSANPIAAGTDPKISTLQIYANGLGPVTNQPASGEPANPNPATFADLSSTTLPVQVNVCGQTVQSSFSGLAPGFVGLYQVNVVIPPSCLSGAQQVSLSVNGVTSKSVRIFVR